jgi:hypothetical protein
MSMVFTFLTCGDRPKQIVYGAIVWKYVRHRPTWRSEKDTVNGMRIYLLEQF